MGAQGRITLHERGSIASACVRDATSAQKSALEAEENALLGLVVAYYTDPGQLRDALSLNARNSAWVNRTERLRVQAEGLYVDLVLRSEAAGAPAFIPDFVDAKARIAITDPVLARRVVELEMGRRALKERSDAISAKVRGLVASCSTIKKLAETWPEGKEFWGRYYDAWVFGKRLPVADVSGVNKLLGLPRPEPAAKVH